MKKNEGNRVLNKWLDEHSENPYPTKDEKKRLAIETNITLTQLNGRLKAFRYKLKRRDGDAHMAPEKEENKENESAATIPMEHPFSVTMDNVPGLPPVVPMDHIAGLPYESNFYCDRIERETNLVPLREVTRMYNIAVLPTVFNCYGTFTQL